MELINLTVWFLIVVKLCQGESIHGSFGKVSHMTDKVCPDNLKVFTEEEVDTAFLCATVCLEAGSICEGLGFNNDTKTCYGCKSFNQISGCGSPLPYVPLTGTVNYIKTGYLVSGVVPIPDEDLSESSYFGPGLLSKAMYARLCKIETFSGNGAFSAASNNQHQWVQARFSQQVMITKTEVAPRTSIGQQFVSSFILLTSDNCVDFEMYRDVATGNIEIFGGAQDQVTGRVADLPYPISALCVRINPTAWVNWISLRFDLIGYYI